MSKKILVIGGNSGIGLATVEMLRVEGIEVISLSRSEDNIDFSAEDVELPEITEPLDGLVYFPGTINLKPFKSLKIADFLYDIQVNYLGAVRVIQKYLPNLQAGDAASIVLFSTVAVQKGMPFHTSVAGAKGAVEGLTKALAAEFAPKIRVNCIAPSLTKTPLADKLLRNEKQLEAATLRHPLKAIGEPKDIAHMVDFLLSDKAKWMSGQIIGIDGGMSTLSA